jgi:hypothetical protein
MARSVAEVSSTLFPGQGGKLPSDKSAISIDKFRNLAVLALELHNMLIMVSQTEN